jgi:hypothetical protein
MCRAVKQDTTLGNKKGSLLNYGRYSRKERGEAEGQLTAAIGSCGTDVTRI